MMNADQENKPMVEFKQILCPVDLGETSDRPLAYAAAFAGWYEATLTVLHVVPTFEPIQVRAGGLSDPVRFLQPMSRDEVLDALERALPPADPSMSNRRLVVEAGEPADTIVDQALAIGADLLVVGTHGRSGFNRFLLGSITEKVLPKSPCPVLTVPPHATGAAPPEPLFRRIICAMDYSPAAMQAFGFALDMARRGQGAITVLHVIEWLPEHEVPEHAHFNVAEFRQHLVQHAHDRLRALITEEPHPGREIVDAVGAGRPHREILRVASEQSADLIVMGAQGRGGAGARLFGSTTRQIVRTAECPVLTVHE